MLKTGLPLIKILIKALAGSVLIPLGLTAAALAADGGIHKKILGPANMITLIISNDEIEDIIKIVSSFEDSGLLLRRVIETVQNGLKEQNEGFLSMLLGTLGASLLGNLLTGRGAIAKSVTKETKSKSQGQGVNRAGKDHGINRAGEGVLRAGYGSRLGF